GHGGAPHRPLGPPEARTGTRRGQVTTSWRDGRKAWRRARSRRQCLRSDDLNLRRARALRARLDLEGDLLSALQAVEVGVGAAPVEEVFLAVFGGDEPEAAFAYELFDCATRHDRLLCLSNQLTLEGSRSRRKRRPHASTK